jgi:DNA repair protein RecN (Recombination protein N)
LISLKIQNLILIEKGEIAFGPGLNILTGETGAGKSAILSAIKLIAGGRADSQMIRKGADFAIVEALLENGTHVRREIYRSGKNRCFIDDRQVPLSELHADIEMIDQNSSFNERDVLDTFAGIREWVDTAEETKIALKIEELEKIPREREQQWAEKDLALFEELNWKEGDEEALAQEHHRLTHAQELAEKISSLLALDLHELKRGQSTLEQCVKFDPSLAPTAASMKSALLELDEVNRVLSRYEIEVDPNQLASVEKRVTLYETLKRRFGPQLIEEKKKLEERLRKLINLEVEIGELKQLLSHVQEKNRALAQSIREKRQKAAKKLTPLILEELKSLNMPHAQLEIAILRPLKKGEKCQGGARNLGQALAGVEADKPERFIDADGSQISWLSDAGRFTLFEWEQYISDEVRFLFSANPGVAPAPLEQCASGGELSRLLLAIKTILSEGSSCIVFDEIDSNVGGKTAAILGEKLKKLASRRQVICVTHFVQVAKCAMQHFLVSKIEKEGSAFTIIQRLDEKTKEKEYERMLGNEL